jgi:hypothetical protein
MKTAIEKVTRVGRVTVFAVGLAVVLALTVGLATTALAAVPGDPFKLGKNNTVNQISQLVGTTASSMLRIDNNGGGTALQLLVEPGKAPLAVNAEAGTATNLSADELDGKDGSAFFSGKTYVVTRFFSGSGGGANRVASADCDSGDRVLSGGGTGNTDQDDQLLLSEPFGQGWDVVVSDNGSASTITAHAVCAEFPPLRP